MKVMAHLLFATSFIFLCFVASRHEAPIALTTNESSFFLFLLASGFLLINYEWIRTINLGEKVNVDPQNMAGYLNEKLFGSYPYVFSLKPTSGSNQSGKRLSSLYSVRNSSFAEFFLTYFDKSLLPILIFIVGALPFLVTDQQAPSFLSFVNRFWVGFAIFGWIISATWLGCISILLFRIRCSHFIKKHSTK